MKASEVLERGKANIERLGWSQGDYIVTDPGGSRVCGVCSLGALRLATLGIEEVTPKTDVYLDTVLEAEEYIAYSDAEDHLGIATGEIDIAAWNDKAHRTVAEVIDVFNSAIAAAKREESDDENQ